MRLINCDICGNEITESKPLLTAVIKKSKFSDSIDIGVHYKDSNKVDFDICKYCVIDAINKLDDRPQEALSA